MGSIVSPTGKRMFAKIEFFVQLENRDACFGYGFLHVSLLLVWNVSSIYIVHGRGRRGRAYIKETKKGE